MNDHVHRWPGCDLRVDASEALQVAPTWDLAIEVQLMLSEIVGEVPIVEMRLFNADFGCTDRDAFNKARTLVFDRRGVPYRWVCDVECEASDA